jgi:hypothetical protein
MLISCAYPQLSEACPLYSTTLAHEACPRHDQCCKHHTRPHCHVICTITTKPKPQSQIDVPNCYFGYRTATHSWYLLSDALLSINLWNNAWYMWTQIPRSEGLVLNRYNLVSKSSMCHVLTLVGEPNKIGSDFQIKRWLRSC